MVIEETAAWIIGHLNVLRVHFSSNKNWAPKIKKEPRLKHKNSIPGDQRECPNIPTRRDCKDEKLIDFGDKIVKVGKFYDGYLGMIRAQGIILYLRRTFLQLQTAFKLPK